LENRLRPKSIPVVYAGVLQEHPLVTTEFLIGRNIIDPKEQYYPSVQHLVTTLLFGNR